MVVGDGNGGVVPPEAFSDPKAGVSNQKLSGMGEPAVQEVGFGRAARMYFPII